MSLADHEFPHNLMPSSLPPVTPESVQRAIDASNEERAAVGIPPHQPPTEDEWERVMALNGLSSLIQKYGGPRVLRWVRNLSSLHGDEV